MKWLERLRAKTATPTGEALTKLPKVAGAGSVSAPSGGVADCSTPPDPSLVDVLDGAYTPKELRRAGKVAKPWGPVRHYPLP